MKIEIVFFLGFKVLFKFDSEFFLIINYY